MTKKLAAMLILLPAIGIGELARAEQAIIRIICDYTYSILGDGSKAEVSGTDLFTIRYEEDGQATIKKQDLGPEFSGTMTDEQIEGVTKYEIKGVLFEQEVWINRYTGQLSLIIKSGAGSEYIQYGTCRVAEKPLF